MAIIKPKNNVKEINPISERIFYEKCLNLDPIKTKEWCIYYSYCINGSYGVGYKNNEIDFLILAPNYGIFIIEVKGGEISVGDNIIFQINRSTNESKIINPYAQAKKNFYTLKNFIYNKSNKLIEIDKFLYGNIVAFTDISNVPNISGESNGYDTMIKNSDLYNFIINYSMKERKNENGKIPSIDDINKIKEVLNSKDFYYKKNLKDYIEDINLSIDDLTDSQKTIFKGLIDNKRCLINGKAGTGKTVLCQFLFKKLVDEKKSVIYFTYNKLINDKVRNDVDCRGNSKCYPIYEYLVSEYERLANNKDYEKINPFNDRINFLFKFVGEQIENNHKEIKKYDCVIIDEAQDILLCDETILFFNNILCDEIKDGSFYVFYDSNQNIFDKKNNNKKIYQYDGFDEYRYTKLTLEKNCRNSIDIEELSDEIVKKKDDNLAKIKKFFNNKNNLKIYEIKGDLRSIIEKIKNEINKLKDDKVDNKQITILFNRKVDENNNILNELKKNYDLEEYSLNHKKITFTTVAKFKGLENDVIIYINDNKYCKFEDHYVAITRAKAIIIIFQVNE